jgi:uncharacterized membrane protein
MDESDAPLAYRIATAIEETETLDTAADVVTEGVELLFRSPRAREITKGEWLGHSLHPLLTDVPLGAWMSASVLDLLGPRRFAGAADALVAVGLVASVPTVVTGWREWLETTGGPRRAGLVHAVANNTAIALYAVSLVARLRGRRTEGIALALSGGAAAAAGGYLGGHLSFSRGVGVDETGRRPG